MITDEMVERVNRAWQKDLEACDTMSCQSDHLRSALEAVYPLIRNQVIEECATKIDFDVIDSWKSAGKAIRSLKT